MVRTFTSTSMLALSTIAFAQTNAPFASRGLVSAAASIGPGLMLDRPTTNIYVTGDWNLFIEDRISLRGQGSWFIDAQQDSSLLKQNSQLSFGPFYHWVKGRSDLSAGLMPGISLTQLRTPVMSESMAPLKLLPNISISGGVTYYVWKYLHFFVNVRYIHAEYVGTATGSLPLDEVVVTAGLGWQVRLFGR
jgi:hypothetical protein